MAQGSELPAESLADDAGSPADGAPFVAAVARTTGIHPKTSRMVSLGLAAFTADGTVTRTWHGTFTIGEDPGPVHLHGLEPSDLEGSPRFGTVLSTIGEFLDGRHVVTHDLPLTWGFIIEEAKRARRHANRANRGRRGRGRGRVRAGRVPAPATVSDTLVNARRQNVELDDIRLRGVARSYGLDAPSPVASVDNIAVPERERTMGDVRLLIDLWSEQVRRAGGLPDGAGDPDASGTVPFVPGFATWAADDLRADNVGLQRSAVRVDAMEAPRPVPNPGRFTADGGLKKGMEFAIAPEIDVPADDIIAAGVAAGLSYSEKVTRETSLLVCNGAAGVDGADGATGEDGAAGEDGAGAAALDPMELTGKAMHAHRKEIPLVGDAEFRRRLDAMG